MGSLKQVLYQGMMEGLNIDRSTRDNSYNMVKHWHPEYEIQFYCDGKRHFFIEDQHYVVKAGSLVLVDSGKIHNTYSNNLIFHDRVLLLFEGERFKEPMVALNIDLAAFFAKYQGVIQVPPADWDYVQKLLQDIGKEVQQKDLDYQSFVALRLAELLIYVLRLKANGTRKENNPAQSSDANLVDEVKRYIRDNCETVGSLEEIADHFYLNKFYLSRLFKQKTGYTITEFTNIQKIRRSQKLLEDTEDSIADIAFQVGYESVTYFNRVFKKYIETSPLQYRKKQIAYKKSLREKNNF